MELQRLLKKLHETAVENSKQFDTDPDMPAMTLTKSGGSLYVETTSSGKTDAILIGNNHSFALRASEDGDIHGNIQIGVKTYASRVYESRYEYLLMDNNAEIVEPVIHELIAEVSELKPDIARAKTFETIRKGMNAKFEMEDDGGSPAPAEPQNSMLSKKPTERTKRGKENADRAGNISIKNK